MSKTSTDIDTTGVQPHLPRLDGKDTYAVNEHNEQVTVIGTMGQDPNERQPIGWRTWAIVVLCAIASFQNVYLG